MKKKNFLNLSFGESDKREDPGSGNTGSVIRKSGKKIDVNPPKFRKGMVENIPLPTYPPIVKTSKLKFDNSLENNNQGRN